MKPANFFYWIQGLFELSVVTELTTSQVECILRHIELVRKTSKNDVLPERFIKIETLLSVFDSLDPVQVTKKIQSWVHEEFHHVIDPSLGSEEERVEMWKIHSPHFDLKNTLIMC